jgi:hypothetical protein
VTRNARYIIEENKRTYTPFHLTFELKHFNKLIVEIINGNNQKMKESEKPNNFLIKMFIPTPTDWYWD